MRHKHKHNRSVKVTNPQSGYLFRSSETLKHDACVCTERAYVYRILRKKCCETFLCVRSWGSFKTQHVRLELGKVEKRKKQLAASQIFVEYKTKLLITAHEQLCSHQFVKKFHPNLSPKTSHPKLTFFLAHFSKLRQNICKMSALICNYFHIN